jgi:glutamyl-tRNA synthetase
MSHKIITRFAPSPTGLLHAGNYRTAIFAYLFAKKQHGSFIVRIEDTDKERSKKEFEENILETLSWLGLAHDELYHQSNHLPRHTEMLQKLLHSGNAYEAENGIVRFKNPNTRVVFSDVVRGEISFDTTELHDFVIARSLQSPLFHLAVVVDDADEGVTHVIRGEDHISNTPRQILIQEALGLPRPSYVHLPLVLAPDKTKLSKRSGAKPLLAYKDEGYLPEALVNYLALLGWHPEGERELFVPQELVPLFELERIQKGAAIFDEVKLRWFNSEHLKRLSEDEFERRLNAFMGAPINPKLISLLKERSQTLGEARDSLAEGEFDFIERVSYEPALLLRGAKTDKEAVQKHLTAILAILEKIQDKDFSMEGIKEKIFPYATKEGRAQVLWPLRVALSGKEKSPDPFTLMELLGKEKTLKRVGKAIEML